MAKRYFKYVSQSVMGMLGVSVYILADTYFISCQAGANGLAVLNMILPIYGLIYAIGEMIGIGSATHYAISKAEERQTEKDFFQSAFWSICFGSLFVILGIFCPDQILRVMGADQTLMDLGRTYLRIVLIAAPVFMVNFTFTAFIRNDGRPEVAMIGSISGSLFNIVFDYILMFPLGMGFTGAALATALSPLVTMSICAIPMLRKKSGIKLQIGKPSIYHLRKACSLGVSAFVGEIAAAVTTITFNMLMLEKAGNIGVAAYGVVANIALVVTALFNGIAQGCQPLFSSSYGRKDQLQLKKLLRLAMGTSLIAMVLIMGVIYGNTGGIIGLFDSGADQALYQYAYDGLRIYFLGFAAASINIILVTYFAATEKAMLSFAGSLMRGLIGIVFWAFVLSRLFGIVGIWSSFLASEVMTFMTILLLFMVQKKTGKGFAKNRD